MARPTKSGIDYFSMDSEKDVKIKLLKGKFGVKGFGMYIELLQRIYSQGFYTKRDEDNLLLFIDETGLTEIETTEMLDFMLEKGLFNNKLYKKYRIITSTGIQKRYIEGTKRRVGIVIPKEYWLLEDYDNFIMELMYTETPKKGTETPKKETFSTQSKVKESKVKESKKEDDKSSHGNPDLTLIVEQVKKHIIGAGLFYESKNDRNFAKHLTSKKFKKEKIAVLAEKLGEELELERFIDIVFEIANKDKFWCDKITSVQSFYNNAGKFLNSYQK